MSLRILASSIAACVFYGVATANTCQLQTLATSVPSTGTGVELQSYSYCAGTLYTQAYIENVDYDKIVTLYYTNAYGKSTPLTAISFGYTGAVDGTNWEYWSANTSNVNIDGITKFLNITFEATDIQQTYEQTLNIPVVASGNPPPTTTQPTPYATPTGLQSDITTWLEAVNGSEASIARDRMFNNIEVPGAANGTVIAAQSYTDPDYAYNWVRDSSLTMDVVQSLYRYASAANQAHYEGILFRYAGARATEQNDPNLQTGLGEPKFNLDNSVFTGPWGRPQNDGAATCAITLMEFSNYYLSNGGSLATIQQQIYDSDSNSQAPVLKDLRFVASNWSSPSFDLWEEEESDQFYTRLVQHRSLVMGSAFATTMGDSDTASMLSTQASALAATLSQFWDPGRNLILYEYGPVLRGKTSFKDVAVILGIIHGYAGDGIFSFTNDQVLASAYEIATSFIPIYGIANTHSDSSGQVLGIPIGRYPEDVYNGTGTSLGNPWYLCTASMAELFYTAASEFAQAQSITVSSASLPFWQYFAPQQTYSVNMTYRSSSPQYSAMTSSLAGWGDAFMRTIKYYTPSDGHLTEEYNRDTGVPQGAADLTWSYAALLTASFARAELNGDQSYIADLANLPFSS